VGYDADTFSPDGNDRTLRDSVNRDGGDTAQESDWFSSCNLGLLSPANVDFIGFFLDTSGSMTEATVSASLTKFRADVMAAGLTISEVFNGEEDWITPFDTTLAPGSPSTVAPGAFASAGLSLPSCGDCDILDICVGKDDCDEEVLCKGGGCVSSEP